MLRKLNFTERARLPRSAVRISLRRGPDGTLAFDPAFALDGVRAPADARVFLEAYFRTSYMRFDCGRVGAVVIPSDRRLTDIDSDNCVRFRLKLVTPEHRIVAVAEDLLVCLQTPEHGGRTPLLPVNFADLGDVVWRVDFDVSGAVLELNNRVDSIAALAKSDPRFLALVYPAAVREILTQIVLLDEHDLAEESDEWWALWVRWAARYAAPPVSGESEDKRTWIDDVVSAFAAEQRLVELLNRKAED